MALALDGTPVTGTATGGTTVASAALTTGGSGIILFASHAEAVNAQANHPTISSISGGGLTWHKRKNLALDNAGFGNAYSNTELWWAYSSGVFSAAITATWGGVTIDDMSCVAWGVNGFTGTDYQTNPWDKDASLPATATSGSATAITVSGVTTSNANGNGMLIGAAGTPGAGTISAGTGYTMVQQAHNGGGTNNSDTYVQYQVYSSNQSSVTDAFGNGVTPNGWMMIGDALSLVGTPAGGGGPPLRRNSSLDGLGASGPFFSNPLARSMLGWRPSIVTARRKLILPRHIERLAA